MSDLEDRIDLCKCRVCGKSTDGWGLEGLHQFTRVQSWCEQHCLEEFEEHDFHLEDGSRYCKRCDAVEDPEDTDQFWRDLADSYYD